MRVLKAALAVMFLAGSMVTVGSVISSGSAEAKAHAKKAAPGKCGTMMYYVKKTKKCASKG